MSERRVEQPSSAELLDGSVIALRRLAPSDTDKVLTLYESLTDEEHPPQWAAEIGLYFRFFTMCPAHLEDWARSIAEGGNEQYAIGAFSSGNLLGVANYVASRQPGYAEVAVAVAHAEHLRGVGTTLLRRLGDIARENGLHHFVAEVLAENHSMLQVLSDGGWPCTRHLEGSVLHVEIDLAEEPSLAER